MLTEKEPACRSTYKTKGKREVTPCVLDARYIDGTPHRNSHAPHLHKGLTRTAHRNTGITGNIEN
jgi:hypothetical protein